MWKANDARNAATFCYYYSDVDSQDSTTAQVAAVINDMYGNGCLPNPAEPAMPSASSTGNATGIRMGLVRRAAQHPAMSSWTGLAQRVNNLLTSDGDLRNYVANIALDVMAIGETVTIYLFDGAPSNDVSSWSNDPTFIGKQPFLLRTMTGYGSSSGVKQASISMNNALISRVEEGRLGGLGHSEVTYYLKQNLQWKVVKVSFALVRLHTP